MCRIISSDAVIGNFILESVTRGKYNISIETMIAYDEKLSESLKEHNYFTKLDFDEILDFTENYPFFVKSMESDCIRIVNELDTKKKLINRLMRHFRIGMPQLVIDEMISASDSVFVVG